MRFIATPIVELDGLGGRLVVLLADRSARMVLRASLHPSGEVIVKGVGSVLTS